MTEKVMTELGFIDQIEACVANFNKRPSWDEYFMGTAMLVSSRSSCNRLNVGCVLVSKDEKRMIAAGYNGFLPGAPHIPRVRDDHELGTVHAEQNAVAYAAKQGVSVKDAIAYITHFPCIHCTKVLIAAGVSDIFYHDDYKNDPIVVELLNESHISIKQL